MKIYLTHFKSQLGEMVAGASDEGLMLFDYSRRRMINQIVARIKRFNNGKIVDGDHELLKKLKNQFNEYLMGNRKEFELPLVMSGTDFQKSVWEELLKIPYGETRSYKQQAIAMGDVNAIRAVARANGENCFAIIIPCHRVIAENGSLTGYAGGLLKKKWLLNFESKNVMKESQGELF